MNRRRARPTDLVFLAAASAALLSCAAAGGSPDLRDGVARLGGNETVREERIGGRLRRRRRAETVETHDGPRRLWTDDSLDDDNDIQISFGDDDNNVEFDPDPVPTEEQSPCKSIIAVGGWRHLSNANHTAVNATYGDFRHASVDEVIPYEDAEEHDTDEEFVCEQHDGSAVPIQGTEEQFIELRRMLNSGDLVSAESTVEVDRSSFMASSEHAFSTSVWLPPGSIKIIKGSDDENLVRRLGSTSKLEGAKKVLIVRVTDRDGRVVDDDADAVSDKFFGTHGDQFTTASGFDACSFGKLTMTNDYEGAVDEDLLSAPGVIDVAIEVSLDESTQDVVAAATTHALKVKLGLNGLPGPFDHVAFVVERCYSVGTSCHMAAWAYINHWLSLFFGPNHRYPAVVMHELGHNLNLAHSGGRDGADYTDHTCLMGNPWFEDDVGRMCFNPAKNFQIAVGGGSWYDRNKIAYYNSGTTGGTSWSGTLVGVADYANNPNGHPIVLKLESGGPTDWFVGFNRVAGINSDAAEASDEVTLTKVVAGDGLQYSQSFLKGTIRYGGQRLTVQDWRGTGMDLAIEARKINTYDSPGYAEVEVTFGPQIHPRPTKSPTKRPTTEFPTRRPTPRPTNSFKTKAKVNDSESGGQMFTVEATNREVRVVSFDVVGKKDGDSECMVYTRVGDYLGHEEDSDGWQLIFYDKVRVGWGVQSNLGALDQEVPIPARSSRSFYVWCKNGMLYAQGNAQKRGAPYDGDGSLVINEGIATKKLFEKVDGYGQYSGGISYYTMGTEKPTARPTRTLTPRPTPKPTPRPTRRPTPTPTRRPTPSPTRRPTNRPTQMPTPNPTRMPTRIPTRTPTRMPIPNPTKMPTRRPTSTPTTTWKPTKAPTPYPTVLPTQFPTHQPTMGDIYNFNSGTTRDTSWSGTIIKSTYYRNNPTNNPVFIRLVSDDSYKWYVWLGGNRVNISKMKNGQTYSMGVLAKGQSETIRDWRNSGFDLRIIVREINMNASPEYTEVEIIFGPQVTPSPTPSPTNKPVSLSWWDLLFGGH